MSKKNPINELGQIVFTNLHGGEKLLVVQIMNCEKHNDTTCVTDSSGSDWCIKCLEEELSV